MNEVCAMKLRQRKAVLALGGGGARGLAHVGAVEVIRSMNFHIERYVGVSIGALVGALCAIEQDSEKLHARVNEYLARGIVNLVFVLAPEVFVLGTIAVAAGEELCIGPVREKVRRHVWPFLADPLRIVPAELGPKMADYAGIGVAIAELERRNG